MIISAPSVGPVVDYRNLIIDAEHGTVQFVRAGIEIDLGAPQGVAAEG